MRHIFLDEAGISANEPVSVVVGVIVSPDEHWKLLEEYLSEVAKNTCHQKTGKDLCFTPKIYSMAVDTLIDKNGR